MSLCRLAACNIRGASSSAVKFTPGHLVRWQSSTASKGSGVLKKLAIGAGVAGGAAVGGMLVYANYDPVFRNKVDEKIPGFASCSDKASDVWVDMTDYFNPKPGDHKKKEEGKFVYEHSKAKIPQEELKKGLKKGQPAPASPSKPEPSSKPLTGEKVVEKSVKKNEEGKKDTTESKVVVKDEPKSGTVNESAGKKQTKEVESRGGETGTTAKELKQDELKSPTGTSDALKRDEVATEEGDTDIAGKMGIEQEASSIQSGDISVDSPQMEVMLDETYESFTSETNRVRGTQRALSSAWENLYHKLTAAYPDDESRDQAVAEAKGAVSAAHNEFKAATRAYDRSSQYLKELLQRAPEKGFMAKAQDMASEMSVQEAEVDLGLVMVKEAVTSAKVVQDYKDAIQESKDKLQKDLEAATALINPERKDSLLLSLNKKVDVLDHKVKEAEADHAQKLTLALEVQRRSLEQLAKDKVEHVLKESEAKYQSELVKEVNKISDHYNGMLREQLRLENESHAKELAEAMRDQADELGEQWSSEMELKLAEQQGFYQTELARAKARLGGLQMMVDSVASAGEKTVKLQTLRNSCDALVGVLDSANQEYELTKRYNVATEVRALRQAADRDPFIATVLDSIPSLAVDGMGIQSETRLKERFVKVKRICKRVALVTASGGGLGTYAVSYLQSLLTLHAWLPEETPADADLSKLHAYNLLHLADAQLKKGDLEGAVHYMSNLQGEPKNVAKDWLEDARLYLETRQAIQLVHANAAVVTARQ